MKKIKTFAPVLGINLMTVLLAVIMITFVGCKEGEENETPVMPAPGISGVTVTPSTSDVPKGYAMEFTATVNGDNLTEADKAVTWTVAGGTKQETAITADGILGISADETAETLTITATSLADNNKKGTATVTVYERQPNPHDYDFEDAEIVEIDFMGEKRLCYYIDGQYIIESDIVIKDDNYEETETISLNKISTRTSVVTGPDFGSLWTEGKVYYYRGTDDGRPETINSGILNAIQEIQTATNGNIKFIELKTFEAREYKKMTRIKFINNGTRSRSYVGMWEGANFQNIWLNKPEDALHEICHALGSIHEHSRPDRDDYIIVFKERIIEALGKEEYSTNYEKWPGTMLYSDAFDYKSVMMYPNKNVDISIEGLGIFTISLPIMRDISNNPLPEPNTNILTSLDGLVLRKMYPNREATPDVFIHTDKIQPTSNSCILTGEVIYEGYPVMTEYGICYREKGTTTLIRQKATKPENVATYSCPLGELKPNTTYEAGIYFIYNGDFYGNPRIEFTTQAAATPQAPEIGTWQGKMSYVNLINNQKMSFNVDLQITPEGSAIWKETPHEPYIALGNSLYTYTHYMSWVKKNNYIEISYNIHMGGQKPDGSPYSKYIPCTDQASLDATNTIMTWEGVRPFTKVWDFVSDEWICDYQPFKCSLNKLNTTK